MLADPEDVCKFEIIFGGDNAMVQALSLDMIAEYYHGLYAEFGADIRLHWGQIIPDGTLTSDHSPNRIRESYPRYDTWREIRDRYDPNNRGLNHWLAALLP